MKFLIQTTCSDSFSPTSSISLIEITEAGAQAILDLHQSAMAFLAEVAGRKLASELFAVDLGRGELVPVFRLVNIPDNHRPNSPVATDHSVFALPDNFAVSSFTDGDGDTGGLECYRVQISLGGISFSALARHGDERFSTAKIPLAVIESVAMGRTIKAVAPHLA